MPPARPRVLDDSRSETSSTITNLKDKANVGNNVGAGITKGRRNASGAPNGLQQSIKAIPNGTAATAVAAAAPEVDPSLPKTEWTQISTSILHSYRTAYRLPTASSYTHPHAALTYQSSPTGLRAPSAILSRRRLREFKHQRRKANNGSVQMKTKGATSGISKDHDHRTKSSLLQNAIAQSIEGTEAQSLAETNAQLESMGHTPVRQTPAALATTVRKHFNAQQLNEADVVSRFIYVVRQSTGQTQGTRSEGSHGDGSGWWMGSNGREVRKGEGGEVGFRLRFRP